MKKILFTLCLAAALTGARGQIYIDSYRFGAANLLIDDYPNAELALSLRKLRNAYTGNCIEVRRSSDSTTQNIGFVNNYLDTSSLKTFCSSTDCFVRTWYDQSGNGRNAQQLNLPNQPKIATNGVIFYKNGTPSLDFDGSNDHFVISSSTVAFKFLHGSAKWGHMTIFASDDGTGAEGLFGTNKGEGTAIGAAINTISTYKISDYITNGNLVQTVSNNPSASNNAITSNTTIITSDYDLGNATAADRSSIYINGSGAQKQNISTNTASSSNASYNLAIGDLGEGGANNFNGSMKEIIMWALDQSSNRTAIRDNANTFYSIY